MGGAQGMVGRVGRSGTRTLARRVPAPAWLLLALLLGFAGGLAAGPARTGLVATAQLVGGLWLDSLRMTVVPLVFALVTTGIAGLRVKAGRLGARLVAAIVALLVLSVLVAALLTPPLLATARVEPAQLAQLRAAFPGTGPVAVPGAAEAIRSLIPVNVVASAAAGAMVPLVVFAIVLGLALGRVATDRAAATLAPLQGLADAMVVVVGWVLRVAAIGIFALAFAIGATTGLAAVGLLGHYLLVSIAVSLGLIACCYPVAALGGRMPMWLFARAAAPAQAVAASTQSSIATLPAMLAGAVRLEIASADAGVTLPLAVAVFKVTAPSNALVVGLAMAWMAGVAVSPTQIALAIPLALVSTFAVLGMPGAVSFFAATMPTALVLGAPLELMPVVLAVDVLPDIARTVANVTADLAVLTVVSRRSMASEE